MCHSFSSILKGCYQFQNRLENGNPHHRKLSKIISLTKCLDWITFTMYLGQPNHISAHRGKRKSLCMSMSQLVMQAKLLISEVVFLVLSLTKFVAKTKIFTSQPAIPNPTRIC